MIKILIVEGMDGTGKSTLINRLSNDLDIPVHERFSKSGPDGGPVTDLWNRTYEDVMTMPAQPLSLYDRHPLISNYVYSPITRRTLEPGFTSSRANRLVRTLSFTALVVWCAPPFDVVKSNLHDNRDMAGVYENASQLYWSYESMRIHWRGNSAVYDYTNKFSYSSILGSCIAHRDSWNVIQGLGKN